jgi:hypothetical protein
MFLLCILSPNFFCSYHYFSCLLAVCSGDGRVNLYRPPIYEFGDNWVKVSPFGYCIFNLVHRQSRFA